MPFCTNCGTAVEPTASFGFIPAILVLASQRFRQNMRVRFDAFQSVYLFLGWLVLHSIGPTLLFAGVPDAGLGHASIEILKLAVVACWIFLLVRAAHEQQVHLPVIGDLAARSTREQL
jgi:uncharacterized membrane protein